VWVNGTVVAMHEGGHTPFHCDITGALLEKGNIVVVRAEDPPTDRYIPRGKQYWEERPVSIFYARTTGIWQTVWLEPVSESYIERVRIEPEIDGPGQFEARIANPAPYQCVTVTVSSEGRTLGYGHEPCRRAAGEHIGDGSVAPAVVPGTAEPLRSPVRITRHARGGGQSRQLLRISFH